MSPLEEDSVLVFGEPTRKPGIGFYLQRLLSGNVCDPEDEDKEESVAEEEYDEGEVNVVNDPKEISDEVEVVMKESPPSADEKQGGALVDTVSRSIPQPPAQNEMVDEVKDEEKESEVTDKESSGSLYDLPLIGSRQIWRLVIVLLLAVCWENYLRITKEREEAVVGSMKEPVKIETYNADDISKIIESDEEIVDVETLIVDINDEEVPIEDEILGINELEESIIEEKEREELLEVEGEVKSEESSTEETDEEEELVEVESEVESEESRTEEVDEEEDLLEDEVDKVETQEEENVEETVVEANADMETDISDELDYEDIDLVVENSKQEVEVEVDLTSNKEVGKTDGQDEFEDNVEHSSDVGATEKISDTSTPISSTEHFSTGLSDDEEHNVNNENFQLKDTIEHSGDIRNSSKNVDGKKADLPDTDEYSIDVRVAENIGDSLIVRLQPLKTATINQLRRGSKVMKDKFPAIKDAQFLRAVTSATSTRMKGVGRTLVEKVHSVKDSTGDVSFDIQKVRKVFSNRLTSMKSIIRELGKRVDDDDDFSHEDMIRKLQELGNAAKMTSSIFNDLPQNSTENSQGSFGLNDSE